MDATETIYYANDMEITETMYFDNNSQHLNFNESGNKGDVQMSFAMAQLAQAYKIVLPSVLIIVMLAMGCTMPLSEIKGHFKKPYGILIGLASQFVGMPAVIYGMIVALKFPPNVAIGALTLACAPGGGLSNIWTYWTDGDVSLSVCMTSVSTCVALGMMPLNLYLYGRSLVSENATIPYLNIILANVSITAPVAVGTLIKRKFPKVAKVITKAGSALGLVAVLVAVIMQSILRPQTWTERRWSIWFAAAAVSALGVCVGLLLSSLARLPWLIRKTIAIETGSQNLPLTLTIITLSYPTEMALEASAVPLLYSTLAIIEFNTFCLLYKLYKWRSSSSKDGHTFKEIPPKEPEAVLGNGGQVVEETSTKVPQMEGGV